MFFNKFPHRANFRYPTRYDASAGLLEVGKRTVTVRHEAFKGGIASLRIVGQDSWAENLCLEPLTYPETCDASPLEISPDFDLSFRSATGDILFTGAPGQAFGVSGEQHLFQFQLPDGTRFYGMGEKTFGRVELSGIRTKFWNTDVWSDFHHGQWENHPTDPPYFTLPYLIARIGDEYVGFLLHNPYPTFFETPGTDEARVFVEWQRTSPTLLMGAEGGQPSLVILYGPTLPELTRKLQKLIGVTPTPPIWALGYHQSRWGYRGHDDLLAVDQEFSKFEIPCESLWMDLDYMDGFRIFKTSEDAFPGGAKRTAEALAKSGRRIVPILDPGVKFEPGYAVYDDGHQAKIFCENPEGGEFVGMVWPGDTVFPDFSLAEGRAWWAGYAKKFREEGFAATWVDMNDPSTGPIDPTSMLFGRGTLPHAAHRNQYALGMQIATHAGFLAAEPNERPFILSRSGFIGSSKYAAIWSGDNLSNQFYLKLSIPTALGMSISGQPFNGPDVGGFGFDVTDELMEDWVKANFLFPFFRNHSQKGTREQAPYQFPQATMRILRRFIRLRYKLIPYLYQLFVNQEEAGEPILRPLFYHYADAGLDEINDQFLVGSSILQAPFLDAERIRSVVLPGAEPWYDARNGVWLNPGTHKVKNNRDTTPLFVTAGSLIAMQPGTPVDNRKDLHDIHVHVFVPSGWSGSSETDLIADDGLTFGYRGGKRSRVRVSLVAVDGHVALQTETLSEGDGPIRTRFVVHGSPKSVRVNGSVPASEPGKVTLAGKPISVTVYG